MRVHGDPWISWVGVIVRVYYTCACVRACLCVVCIVAYVCFVLSKCMFRACSLPQVCINSHSFILVLVCVHVRAYPDIRRLPRSRAMFSSIHMYTYTHSHTHTHTHTHTYTYTCIHWLGLERFFIICLLIVHLYTYNYIFIYMYVYEYVIINLCWLGQDRCTSGGTLVLARIWFAFGRVHHFSHVDDWYVNSCSFLETARSLGATGVTQ